MNWEWIRSEFFEEGEPPPRWNNNPSAWSQRSVLVGLALTGLGIAVYLGFYQVGIIGNIWEPFYGKSSEIVLRHSPLSWLIPDAWVGAFVYFLEVIFGAIGGRERWRTQPWAVLIEAVLTTLMAVGSVILTAWQPFLTGMYCTMCLASAACSVVLVGFSLTEALAALQHLERARRQGAPWWDAFWGEGDWARRLIGRIRPLQTAGRQ
jgi:hypothetical protein